jgi:hypothetical protein
MIRRVARVATVTILSATVLAAPVVAASAAPSDFWTHISVPSKTLTYRYTPGVANQLHVAGQTANDVTQVDIDCITFIVGEEPQIQSVAQAVPVTSGAFSVTGTLPGDAPTNCRLRAIPDGIDPTVDYLGAYSGPILYADAFGRLTTDGKTYGYLAQSEEGDGATVQTDVGSCGTEAVVTVEAPQMEAGPIMLTCLFGLPDSNVDPSGTPTHSAIRVDGHNAYLPSGINEFRGAPQSLTVPQTSLKVNRSIAHNGDVTITESAALMRCSVSDQYPPTTPSCPTLLATGVTFKRITTFWRDGHQVKIRDTFTSTNHHAHTVTLQYVGEAENETNAGTSEGRAGFTYPTHGSAFHASSLGHTITGFGPKAGTLLLRSDLHARADDPEADTTAATWSRPPSKIMFSSDPSERDQFGMAYRVKIPARGTGFLGFATSERWSTSDVKALASMAVAEMVDRPSISSPHHGARIHGNSTTVKGSLTAGANGLPTRVSVNGHPAQITKTGLTTATYSVTFSESTGKHTITVLATDSVGNSASSTISVKNV